MSPTTKNRLSAVTAPKKPSKVVADKLLPLIVSDAARTFNAVAAESPEKETPLTPQELTATAPKVQESKF